MKKIGISCGKIVRKYGYEKAFELCKESGFDAVDFDLALWGKRMGAADIYNASEDEFEAHFTAIRAKAESLELEISQTHGRCTTYTPDEKQCEYARWASEKDLQATRLLGAGSCVIHSIKSGDWPENYQDGEFMHRKNKEFFDCLIPIAEKNKVNIALETFGRAKIYGDKNHADFFAHVRELKKQFDLLDTKNKTICVDIGHTNEAVIFGVPGPAEVIRTLGSDVTLLHLHDNNGSADQHLPPLMGRGTINWSEIFNALDDIGYKGVYNFELELGRYGDVLDDATRFLGKWLRHFVDVRGEMK